VHQLSSTAFVGRARELGELHSGLEDVLEGHGRFFLVTGEPGIGKTRLAEELAGLANERGVLVNWGLCWDGAGAPAYWPWIQIFRSCFRSSGYSPTDLIADAEHLSLANLVPEIFERGGSKGAATTAAASNASEQDRFRFFDSVTRVLQTLSLARPLAILMDDLHAADQASLQLLIFIARGLRQTRIFLLGTYRDNEIRNSPAASGLFANLTHEARELPLSRFNGSEIEEYLSRCAVRLNSSLRDGLAQVSGGNPLFLDGVVRMLQRQQTQPDQPISPADFNVPDGVREAIRSRVQRLSPEARSLLRVASVIGKEFELECIQQVDGRSLVVLLPVIDELSQDGIIIPASVESSFRFCHDLIRDTIYKDIPTPERLELHEKVAQSIERINRSEPTQCSDVSGGGIGLVALEAVFRVKPPILRSNIGVHLARLAYHYEIAASVGNLAKAIDYQIQAGEAALIVFAYEETTRHWTRAIQLLERRIGSEKQRAELYFRLGWMQASIDRPTRIRYLEEALKLYAGIDEPYEKARVHITLGGFYSGPWIATHTDIPRALEHYREAETLLRQAPPRNSSARIWAELEWMRAVTAVRALATREGTRAARCAMAIARDLGDDMLLTWSSLMCSLHLGNAGQLAEARKLAERVLQSADQINDTALAVDAACRPGMQASLYDPRLSERWYRAELVKPRTANSVYPRQLLARRLGEVTLWRDAREAEKLLPEMSNDPATWSPGFIAFWKGDWEEAEEFWTTTYEHSRRVGGHDEGLPYLSFLAWTRRLLSRYPDSHALLDEALKVCSEEPLELIEMWVRPEFVVLCTEMSKIEQAQPHLDRCRELIATAEDWCGLAGRVTLAEAVVAAARGDLARANTEFAQAVSIFRSYDIPFWEAETFYYWAHTLNSAGEYARAAEQLDTVVEIYRRAEAGPRWIERALAKKCAPRPSTIAATRDREARFRREGDYWLVSFDGTSARLKHAKGMVYLAYLLQHPSIEFSAVDLIYVDQGHEPASESAHLQDGEDQHDLRNDLGDAGVALDSEAKTQYRRRIKELREELDEAKQLNDMGRTERLQAEINFFTAELVAAVTKNGKDRKAASHVERARLAVYKRIEFSLREIRRANPVLAAHLTAAIRTGYNCIYLPKKPIQWTF
jgi:tetratricopeptide (TPR) repeat protein